MRTTTGSWCARGAHEKFWQGMCSSHVFGGLENWEEELPRRYVRKEGPVDESWVEEVDEFPGGGVSPSRLMEHGTPSTLESSLTQLSISFVR